jgi:N6-L-threonylcarbamoyladenine synthase
VEDGQKILAQKIYSQCEIHRPFGGVFPELASRSHVEKLTPLLQQLLNECCISKNEIDLVAVAKGPGLIGSLLIGINTAKTLAWAWQKPVVGVNHVEAHLYAAMMGKEKIAFPALGVVISGGHTFLAKIEALGSYTLIGTTVDDAIGEAFDKVASLLGLPYPGGPAIEKLAKEGDASRFSFKSGRVKDSPWDFSFSGLKTSVLYAAKGANSSKESPLLIAEEEKADIASAFQEAALGEIVHKTLAAAKEFDCKAIFLGGGVSCNTRLRELFVQANSELEIFWPSLDLCLDNAAMIAGLGFHTFKLKGADGDELEPMTRIPLF